MSPQNPEDRRQKNKTNRDLIRNIKGKRAKSRPRKDRRMLLLQFHQRCGKCEDGGIERVRKAITRLWAIAP